MGHTEAGRGSGWCELKLLGGRKKLDFDSRGWGSMRRSFGFTQGTGSHRGYFKESIKKNICEAPRAGDVVIFSTCLSSAVIICEQQLSSLRIGMSAFRILSGSRRREGHRDSTQ